MALIVWDFFKVFEEDRSLVICNKCSKQVPRGAKSSTSFDTSNLISHLKHNHRFDGVLKAYEDARAAKDPSNLKPAGTYTHRQGFQKIQEICQK